MLRPSDFGSCPRGGLFYVEPSTGVQFRTTGIPAILDKIYKHRVANDLPHASGWEDEVLSELCRTNPHLRCEETVSTPHRIVLEGRAAWKALHEYALAFDDESLSEAQQKAREWLVEWRKSIPKVGCQCRDKFQRIEAARPVDLASRDAFFSWSVAIHNDVSRSLGKPTMSFDEALAIWSPQAP